MKAAFIKNFLRDIKFVSVTILISLFFFNLLVLIYGKYFIDEGRYIADRALGWKLKPNFFYESPTNRGQIESFRTNSGGWTSTLNSYLDNASASGDRVAVVGDSFVQANIAVPEIWTELMNVNLKRDDKRMYTVHNYGVSGWSLQQYSGLINDKLLSRNYSHIIVAVYMGNDFYEMTQGNSRYDVHRGHLISSPSVVPGFQRVKDEVKSYLPLYSLIVNSFRLIVSNTQSSTNKAVMFYTDPQLFSSQFSESKALQTYVSGMKSLAEKVERSGAKFSIVVIPSSTQLSRDLYNRTTQKLHQFGKFEIGLKSKDIFVSMLRSRGLRVIDFGKEMGLDEMAVTSVYGVQGGHFTQSGHMYMARVVGNYLTHYASNERQD